MRGYLPRQVFNGTYGEVWFDGEYLAEIISFKAEIGIKTTGVKMIGHLVEGQKMTALEPKGEMKINKINSVILKKLNESLKKGKMPTFTIMSKIDDPDAITSERIVCRECVLDKMILADWETGKNSEESYSFTFTDWDLLDN